MIKKTFSLFLLGGTLGIFFLLFLIKVNSQTSASIWIDAQRIFLNGNPRFLDGTFVNPNTTPLQVVIFDTNNIRPVRKQPLDSSLAFSVSMLSCSDVFFYESVFSGKIINSASISPGNGISRDLIGNNFKLINCDSNLGDFNEVRLDGSTVKIFSSSKILPLINGVNINMNNTPLAVVIFDGRTFLRRVPLVSNNDSFSILEVPCLTNARWYYETLSTHIPVNSGFLNAGPGIIKNFAGQNFQLASCNNHPPPPQGSSVYLNGTQITLNPYSNQVTLVNGSIVSPYSNPLEAVIFDLFGRGISYVVWLDSNLSFNRSLIPTVGNYVWFYRLRGGGMAVNSGTLSPGTCISYDLTGGNFRLVCN